MVVIFTENQTKRSYNFRCPTFECIFAFTISWIVILTSVIITLVSWDFNTQDKLSLSVNFNISPTKFLFGAQSSKLGISLTQSNSDRSIPIDRLTNTTTNAPSELTSFTFSNDFKLNALKQNSINFTNPVFQVF